MNVAPTAGPPSPLYDAVPVPAVRLMVPLVTSRTQLRPLSPMNTRLPLAASPVGWRSDTDVGLPENEHAVFAPPPAKRLMAPADVTLRMQLLALSAM